MILYSYTTYRINHECEGVMADNPRVEAITPDAEAWDPEVGARASRAGARAAEGPWRSFFGRRPKKLPAPELRVRRPETRVRRPRGRKPERGGYRRNEGVIAMTPEHEWFIRLKPQTQPLRESISHFFAKKKALIFFLQKNHLTGVEFIFSRIEKRKNLGPGARGYHHAGSTPKCTTENI